MTKKTFLQAIIALIIPVIFYAVISGFKNSTPEHSGTTNIIMRQNPPQIIPKDFTNFILNESYGHTNALCNDEGTNWQMENFLDKYRAELNFNGVHMYDFFDGTDCMGRFAQPMNGGQISKVQSLIDAAHTNGLKAIFMRSNLPDLCRSQRLVYEVTQPPGNHNTNYGFCYNTTAGKFETESDGTTSIHACVSPVNCNIEGEFDAVPQYICRDIYENLQHTDLPYFQLTEQGTWYLKPRMKIKQSDFSPTDDRPVVTIEVVPFDGGAPIASKIIRIRNFKNNNQQYDGNYIDLFNFSDEPFGTNLEVSGNMTDGLCRGWTEVDFETKCKVDFRIKWEGNVDVWFDKLTVDDNRANVLFNPNNNLNYSQYIDAELSNFGGTGSNKMDMFFCDEIVNSNIEACKYVLNYVRNSAYPDTRITIAGTNGLNVFSMRNDNLGFRPFLENVHPDYFQVDAHRFWGWRDPDDHEYHDNYYPDNITPTDPKVPAWYHPDGWMATKTEYNNSLQTYYMGSKTENYGGEGTFIYQVRMARDQIDQYSPNTRFIMQPQLQSWIKETQINGQYDSYYDEGNREPTDQEYEMQAMLSLAHGADG